MKITITKTVQNQQVGWTQYQPGAHIDVRYTYAQALIDAGEAREGWGAAAPPPAPPEPEPVPEPSPDYAAMTVKDLRVLAKAADVWKRGMKRDEMITALEASE